MTLPDLFNVAELGAAFAAGGLIAAVLQRLALAARREILEVREWRVNRASWAEAAVPVELRPHAHRMPLADRVADRLADLGGWLLRMCEIYARAQMPELWVTTATPDPEPESVLTWFARHRADTTGAPEHPAAPTHQEIADPALAEAAHELLADIEAASPADLVRVIGSDTWWFWVLVAELAAQHVDPAAEHTDLAGAMP